MRSTCALALVLVLTASGCQSLEPEEGEGVGVADEPVDFPIERYLDGNTIRECTCAEDLDAKLREARGQSELRDDLGRRVTILDFVSHSGVTWVAHLEVEMADGRSVYLAQGMYTDP